MADSGLEVIRSLSITECSVKSSASLLKNHFLEMLRLFHYESTNEQPRLPIRSERTSEDL